MVLSPVPPVETAPFPYSTHTDPSPVVIESGCVALIAPPVAKTETLTVGAACAQAAAMKRTMGAIGSMGNVIAALRGREWLITRRHASEKANRLS
jgi:hypothetical protein